MENYTTRVTNYGLLRFVQNFFTNYTTTNREQRHNNISSLKKITNLNVSLNYQNVVGGKMVLQIPKYLKRIDWTNRSFKRLNSRSRCIWIYCRLNLVYGEKILTLSLSLRVCFNGLSNEIWDRDKVMLD